MRNFRGIEFEVIKRESYGNTGDVFIDLKSVDKLATSELYVQSISLDDYMSKLETLGDDIEDLGKMIYKEDPHIYFGYYTGISLKLPGDELFAFGVNHRSNKNTSHRYNHTFTKLQIERALKINSILGGNNLGG